MLNKKIFYTVVSMVLVIASVITSIPFAYGATVIPVVNSTTENNEQQVVEEDPIIVDHTIQMVILENTSARLEPNSDSKEVITVTGGTVVTADIHSLGSEFIGIEYNNKICYIEPTKAKAIVGKTPAIEEQITNIYNKCKYNAEGIVEIIPAPTHYSVNGAVLYYNYQDFIYTLCKQWGVEEYFPILLCQFYQESRFKQSAISSTNDYGICQLNARYHDAWEKEVGHPEWDVKTDPYANMYIGVYLMANKIKNRNGNIDIAMTDYNAGGGYYGKYGIRYQYTNHVHNWESTLKALD